VGQGRTNGTFTWLFGRAHVEERERENAF